MTCESWRLRPTLSNSNPKKASGPRLPKDNDADIAIFTRHFLGVSAVEPTSQREVDLTDQHPTEPMMTTPLPSFDRPNSSESPQCPDCQQRMRFVSVRIEDDEHDLRT